VERAAPVARLDPEAPGPGLEPRSS
jgi:hypothetical protein